MEIENIAEYYDELFPVSDKRKTYFKKLLESFPSPGKVLRIECATGTFEHFLAKEGYDVTGIDESSLFVKSVNRKRHDDFITLRCFQMSYLEMVRFLGKNFYNVISMLDGKIFMVHDEILMTKFFCDCKTLLSEDGKLVLSFLNLENVPQENTLELPPLESSRTKLFAKIEFSDGGPFIFLEIETGSGKHVQIADKVPVYILKPSEIKKFAEKAGFKNVELYEDFSLKPFTENSPTVVAVLS